MGAISARFFAFVQGADFYRALHREAVALLPAGAGQTWFDIGSGAGLVATLAHQRGYKALGFDRDAHMVQQAQRRSAHSAGPRFVECGLHDLVARHGRANVVSAASLLSVLPDQSNALKSLLDAVAPGGALLVIETSGPMASEPWDREKRRLATGRRRWVLRLWARVRQGTHSVDIAALCPPGYEVQKHSLLGGLVNAWIVRQSRDMSAPASAAKGKTRP